MWDKRKILKEMEKESVKDVQKWGKQGKGRRRQQRIFRLQSLKQFGENKIILELSLEEKGFF